MADVPGFAPENTPRQGTKGAAHWQDAKGKTSKGPMIGCTLLALCAVGGIILALISWFDGGDDEPYFVTIPIGEYSDPAWPANPWVYEDSTMLAECFKTRDGQPLASNWKNSQQQNRLQTGLDSIANGSIEPGLTGQLDKAAGRPLVIHINSLAVARNRMVYLLPAEAKPEDSSNWIPITKLLDAVQACKSPKKLLILDISRPVADPYNGVLRNDVAAVLHDLLDTRNKSSDPLKYSVITSCAPGELSIPADPAHCTAFALAMVEGLNGAADKYNKDETSDDQVTVSELAQFVAARVSRYALKVRNVRQTPQFYPAEGPDADFVVAFGKVKKVEFKTSRGNYPGELRSAWANRDLEAKTGAANGYPIAFARLTGGIVRAEETWRGSDRVDHANLELTKVTNFWKDHGPKSGRSDPVADKLLRARDTMGDWRLVVARTKHPAPAPDWTTAFNTYANARFAAKPAPDKPDETGPLRTAWLAKAKENPIVAAGMVWEKARKQANPKQSDLAVYADMMKELKDEGLTRNYSEIVLLRALAARNFWKEQRLAESSYPGSAIALLLNVENEIGLTLAAGPEGWELVPKELEVAEADRREGQKLLFAADRPETVAKAETALKQSADKFKAVRLNLEEWSKANRVLQESIAAVVATQRAALEWNVPKFSEWEEAAAASTRLAKQLKAERQAGRFQATNVTDLWKKAESTALGLMAAVGHARAEQLLKENKSRDIPQGMIDWQAVVSAPLAQADARKSIWDAIIADTAKFHQIARQDDEDDTEKNAITGKPPPVPRGVDPERIPAENRAKAALALLRLAGLAQGEQLQSRLDRNTGAASEFEPLGDEIRKIWIDDWPTQMKANLKAERWFDAAQLAHATPPGAVILRDPDPIVLSNAVAVKSADKLIAAYFATADGQFRADKDYRSRDDAGFYTESFLPVP